MDDIRIYDTAFKLMHIEDKVISSNWTVKFNSVGSFEIHTLADTETAGIILDNLNVEQNKIPVITQGNLQGVVTGIRLSDDCAIYGKTLNWFLSKKIVPKFVSGEMLPNKSVEDVVRQLVSDAFADQPDFILGKKVGLDLVEPIWRNTYNPLSEVVADILDKHHAGHKVVFDAKEKRWIFEIVPCRHSNTIISPAMGNAFAQEYTYNVDSYSSECWYQQEQEFIEGEFPEPVWTKLVKDEKNGIFRMECVVDAVDEYDATIMLDKKPVSAEIVTDLCGLSRGEDFDIGDILRVQFTKGEIARTAMKQIAGISLGWENGVHTREVILKDI